MLYDFNFVCCALATVSAAVGYRYSRRCAGRGAGLVSRLSGLPFSRKFLSRRRGSRASDTSVATPTSMSFDTDSLSDYPTPSDSADVTEPGTLKRKTREDDIDNYADDKCAVTSSPDRRSSSPPRKRCRTPTPEEPQANVTEVKRSPAVEREEPEADRAGPPHDASLAAAAAPLQTGIEQAHDSDMQTDAQAQVSSVSAIEGPPPPPDVPVTSSKPTSSPPASAPSTLPSSFSIPVCKPSSAFSAFAGPGTAFGVTLVGTDGSQRPAWYSGPSTGDSRLTDVPETAEHVQAADSGVSVHGSAATLTPARDTSVSSGGVSTPDALAAHVRATSTHVGSTGEEEEDATSELKGVKLFVKRGGKDFSGGMLGHVKLLAHKESREERLVFRREPVWKVSMSVRLRPAVRCIFDEEHGILRLMLKEPVEQAQGDKPTPETAHEVVVYALTKGKSSKADFAQFARAVASSTRLAEQVPTQIVLS